MSALESHIPRDERQCDCTDRESIEAAPEAAGEDGHAHRLRILEASPVAFGDFQDGIRDREVEREHDRADERTAHEAQPGSFDDGEEGRRLIDSGSDLVF